MTIGDGMTNTQVTLVFMTLILAPCIAWVIMRLNT